MSGDPKREVKPETATPGPSGAKPAARLQSLSATVKPGSARSARSFTPNLAMAGKRVEPSASPSNKRKQPERQKQKQVVVKKEKPKKEFIATKGIFSQGVKAQEMAKKAAPDRLPRGGGGGALVPGKSSRSGEPSTAASKLPSVTDVSALNRNATQDDVEEIKELLAGTNVSDIPVSDIATSALPLAVKSETDMDTSANMLPADVENGEFVFLQLPTILPELLADRKSQEKDTDPSAEPSISHPFDGMTSGRIGKLQRLRDGRLRLNLGNGLIIPLEPGMQTGFRQDVAVVNHERLAVVGSVKQRYIGTPQFC